MPKVRTEKEEIYKKVNGVTTLIKVVDREVSEPTQEELLAEKEAQLLEIYAEIEALKSNK